MNGTDELDPTPERAGDREAWIGAKQGADEDRDHDMRELRIAALREAAVEVVAERQMNPMNGDTSNAHIDLILRRLDRLAGDSSPSDAAEHAWAIRMDKYEADYCAMHDIPRAKTTHVERLMQKRAAS